MVAVNRRQTANTIGPNRETSSANAASSRDVRKSVRSRPSERSASAATARWARDKQRTVRHAASCKSPGRHRAGPPSIGCEPAAPSAPKVFSPISWLGKGRTPLESAGLFVGRPFQAVASPYRTAWKGRPTERSKTRCYRQSIAPRTMFDRERALVGRDGLRVLARPRPRPSGTPRSPSAVLGRETCPSSGAPRRVASRCRRPSCRPETTRPRAPAVVREVG